MNKLSVGKRIMFSFAIVLALILVILGVTVFTSIRRNNDLDNVNTMGDLQQEANEMLDELSAARIELRTVYTSAGAEAMAAYEKAMPLLSSASNRVSALENYDSQLDAVDMSAANAQIKSLFGQLITKVEQVHSNDLTVQQYNQDMTEASQEMHTAAVDLVVLLDELVAELHETSPNLTIDRLNNIIAPAQNISTAVDQMRVDSSYLLLNMDTSVAANLTAELDSIVAQANDLYTHLSTDEGRAATDIVLSEAEEYRTAMNNLIDVIADSNGVIEEARSLTDTLAGIVNDGVDALASQSDDMIVSTTDTSMFVLWLMTAIVLIAAVASVLMALTLTRSITRPLNMMKGVLVQVGETGNMTFTDETKEQVRAQAAGRDEISQSIGAFAHMMDRMIYVGECLTTVANGDLTVDVELVSPEDTMGIALKNMTDNLNDMFSEINSVSSQVSTASGEIAQGAQSLAQGSTEQASTVEEISASINEINEQANLSSETAVDAAAKGNEITRIAQEGSEKMERMMEAVQQINEASQNIGDVIKVIDNIAFQTNILALNAAVEAARAGQHGKGFAVVADEVRNLASKSADAAKETAALISANIEKAELGLSISQDTAESLTQIVEGIQSTSESLQQLAEQSAGSKAATAQVNLAVDQVAQVVQQNSATSEESAAASEEMSSQAQVLQQLIARFRLRDAASVASIAAGESVNALPAAGESYTTGGEGDIIF
ncbi:methyl-accepting chemotaxis protein [Ruminococcaceae bacterium OttesenSCG-928-O06]|nr:methyl-accepting chemotaxis protein [Ruminococcaceae bacterium OttesenSCG-928-O06]